MITASVIKELKEQISKQLKQCHLQESQADPAVLLWNMQEIDSNKSQPNDSKRVKETKI